MLKKGPSSISVNFLQGNVRYHSCPSQNPNSPASNSFHVFSLQPFRLKLAKFL